MNIDELELAQKRPDGIGEIDNPSEELQKIAVKRWRCALGRIKNPSEAVQIAYVKTWGGDLRSETMNCNDFRKEIRDELVKMIDDKLDNINPKYSNKDYVYQMIMALDVFRLSFYADLVKGAFDNK